MNNQTTTEAKELQDKVLDIPSNYAGYVPVASVVNLMIKEKAALLEDSVKLLKTCTSSGDLLGAHDVELEMYKRFKDKLAHSQEDREGKETK